jgi:hypothetical protein
LQGILAAYSFAPLKLNIPETDSFLFVLTHIASLVVGADGVHLDTISPSLILLGVLPAEPPAALHEERAELFVLQRSIPHQWFSATK